jgi:hypothetical protein
MKKTSIALAALFIVEHSYASFSEDEQSEMSPRRGAVASSAEFLEQHEVKDITLLPGNIDTIDARIDLKPVDFYKSPISALLPDLSHFDSIRKSPEALAEESEPRSVLSESETSFSWDSTSEDDAEDDGHNVQVYPDPSTNNPDSDEEVSHSH